MLHVLLLQGLLSIAPHAIHPQPFIDYDPKVPSGVGELLRRQKFCIGNTCVAPSYVYVGGACTASGCPEYNGGPTLVRVSNTTAASYGVPSPPLSDDTNLGCNGGDYFEEPSAALSAFGTDDIIIEAFYRYGQAPAGTQTLFSTYTSGDNQGIRVSTTTASVGTAGTETTIFGDGGGTVSLSAGASSARRRAWTYHLWLLDRSGSGQIYQGGNSPTPVVISARSAALTAAHKFTLCADVGGSNPWDGDVAYLAFYHAPAFLDTHLRFDWAFIRNRQLLGAFPFIDRYGAETTLRGAFSYVTGGIAAGVTDTMTKCDTLTGVCSIFQVNIGMAENGRAADGSAGPVSMQFRSTTLGVEKASTKTKINAGDSYSVAGTTVPEPDFLGDGLIAANTNTTHGVKDTQILSAGGLMTYSVFAKAGNKTWARIIDSVTTNGFAYVNLSTCAFGTIGAGVSAHWLENYGGGWCRFGITFPSTNVSHDLETDAATGDGSLAFAGDGSTVSIWLWGFQGEQLPVMTKLMIDGGNNSGGISNLASSPMANGVGWEKRGHMMSRSTSLKAVTALSINSSSRVAGQITATSGQSTFMAYLTPSFTLQASYAPDGSCTGTTPDGDLSTHTYATSWDTVRGEMRLFVDGAQECVDATTNTANATPGIRFSVGMSSEYRLLRAKLYNWSHR